jgi:hypothetical protein
MPGLSPHLDRKRLCHPDCATRTRVQAVLTHFREGCIFSFDLAGLE